MTNLAFALTDFLVVIGAAIGLWRLWPQRRHGEVRMIRMGLVLMALAALVGTIRFASGQIDGPLATAHGIASSYAAAAGLLLIATGLALTAFRVRLPAGVTRYIRMGIPVFIAFLLVFPGSDTLLGVLPALALLIGLAGAGALLTRRDWPAGLVWLAAFGLLAFASLVIGGSRDATTLGLANWHIYHALLGVWAVLTGEGARRMMARPGG
ncbi:hypothetical protein [Maricaulis virginensis]|uniref:Uncharacterized protein n=1 Tax=Maricaulis virginensis TaxID=144022 RepID=A0A9W6INI1_9PROT|nr:hypothetical protein [Maricaulis virginensis]GLK52747.1 hypothetical protein GCM10017621_22550 [Maricaulis virginensis]